MGFEYCVYCVQCKSVMSTMRIAVPAAILIDARGSHARVVYNQNERLGVSLMYILHLSLK